MNTENKAKIASRLSVLFARKALSLFEQFESENAGDKLYLLIEITKILRQAEIDSTEFDSLIQQIDESLQRETNPYDRDCMTLTYLRLLSDLKTEDENLALIHSVNDSDLQENARVQWLENCTKKPVESQQAYDRLLHEIDNIEDLNSYERATIALHNAGPEFCDMEETFILNEILTIGSNRIEVLLNSYKTATTTEAQSHYRQLILDVLNQMSEPSDDRDRALTLILQLSEFSSDPNSAQSFLDRYQIGVSKLKVLLTLADGTSEDDPYYRQALALADEIKLKEEADVAFRALCELSLFQFVHRQRSAGIKSAKELMNIIRQDSFDKKAWAWMELFYLHENANEFKAARQILGLAEKEALTLDSDDAKSFYFSEIVRAEINAQKKKIMAFDWKSMFELANTIPGNLCRIPLLFELRFYQTVLEEETQATETENGTPETSVSAIVEQLVDDSLNDIQEFSECTEQAYLLFTLADRASKIEQSERVI